MKISEMQETFHQHPNAVYRVRGRSGAWQYVGTVKEKSWSASRPTTKVVMRPVKNGLPSLWTEKFTPASIYYSLANSIDEYEQKMTEHRMKQEAARAAEKAERAAKEAARTKAREAMRDNEEAIRAGLANVLGCKQDAITFDSLRGEVRIVLAGDVALNIVHEKAYCYS